MNTEDKLTEVKKALEALIRKMVIDWASLDDSQVYEKKLFERRAKQLQKIRRMLE